VMQAAEAIIRVANAKMAGAVRLISVERGHDPKKFVAMPFGGGGALHTGALIKDVGLAKALVPRYPGVTSALGCVIADMRHDRVRTVNAMLDAVDPAVLGLEIRAAGDELQALLDASGVRFDAVERLVELDMLYLGQTHTIAASLPSSVATGEQALTRAVVLSAFEAAYRAAFGRLLDGIAIRIMNWKIAVIGKRPKFDLKLLAPAADASIGKARKGSRPVYADGRWQEASLWRRLDLPVGAVVDGPAILDQADTTIFVDPDLKAEVDAFGNLILSRKGE